MEIHYFHQGTEMNSLISTSLAACLAVATGLAMAQDTTKAATKMEAKKDLSMQDCKDHMNTIKGQKRTDPATAETTAKCDAMMKNGGKTGTDGTKPTGGMTAPSTPK
jgi:hypothetical protein